MLIQLISGLMKNNSVNILGIETSCDETAAAIVADGGIIKSSIVASQTQLHEKYGGVVPEIASRAHIEKIYPVIAEAIERANVTKDDISAIAVANQPGLTIALVVGVTAAKPGKNLLLQSIIYTPICSRQCCPRRICSCRR